MASSFGIQDRAVNRYSGTHGKYSPGDARYACYRYSIYVFGIFTLKMLPL